MSTPPPRLPVAEHWFTAETISDGLTLLTEPYVDPFLRSNLWLVRGRDRDLLVDTGNGISPLRRAVAQACDRDDKSVVAVATHTHSDHMGGMHEFGVRVVHRLEAEDLRHASDAAALVTAELPERLRLDMAESGSPLPPLLISALPYAGFDPVAFAVTPAAPTHIVEEGDVIDLGDRRLEVLHLPGHSPGSIGLWETASGTLFSGDVVYRDGPLLDDLPGSDVAAYLHTMARLRDLRVRVVHAGHDPSFDREQLLGVVGEYIARRAG